MSVHVLGLGRWAGWKTVLSKYKHEQTSLLFLLRLHRHPIPPSEQANYVTAGSQWRCELLLSSSPRQGQADWPRLMGRCGAKRGGGQAPRGALHHISKLSLFTTRGPFSTRASTNRINLGRCLGGSRRAKVLLSLCIEDFRS